MREPGLIAPGLGALKVAPALSGRAFPFIYSIFLFLAKKRRRLSSRLFLTRTMKRIVGE
jgi:hypothetical protein